MSQKNSESQDTPSKDGDNKNMTSKNQSSGPPEAPTNVPTRVRGEKIEPADPSAESKQEATTVQEDLIHHINPDETDGETYWWVEWGAKSEAHEPDTVRIWVNGVGRRWNRMVPVIVPQSYIEAARHTLVEKFQMEPGKRMKKRAPQQRYIPRILHDRGNHGQATKEEYFNMLSTGTETRNLQLSRQNVQD